MGKVPRLPHLQFLVLGALAGGPLLGRELRDRLAKLGARKSGPAFYQLMARLEDAGYVDGDYQQEVVDSQIIRERHYTLTGAGMKEWKRSADFYLQVIGFVGGHGRPANA